MKKVLTLLVAVVAIMTCMVGCGQKSTSSVTPSATSSVTPSATYSVTPSSEKLSHEEIIAEIKSVTINEYTTIEYMENEDALVILIQMPVSDMTVSTSELFEILQLSELQTMAPTVYEPFKEQYDYCKSLSQYGRTLCQENDYDSHCVVYLVSDTDLQVIWSFVDGVEYENNTAIY